MGMGIEADKQMVAGRTRAHRERCENGPELAIGVEFSCMLMSLVVWIALIPL